MKTLDFDDKLEIGRYVGYTVTELIEADVEYLENMVENEQIKLSNKVMSKLFGNEIKCQK